MVQFSEAEGELVVGSFCHFVSYHRLSPDFLKSHRLKYHSLLVGYKPQHILHPHWSDRRPLRRDDTSCDGI